MKMRNYVSFDQVLVSVICINARSSTLCFLWVFVGPQKLCQWITWGSQACTWTALIWNIFGKITDSALGNSSLTQLWQSLSKTITGDVFSHKFGSSVYSEGFLLNNIYYLLKACDW